MIRLYTFFFALVFLSRFALGVTYDFPDAYEKMDRVVIDDNSFFYSVEGDRNGYIEFRIDAPQEGYYKVDAKVLAEDGRSNSFFVQVDERFPQYWNIKEDPRIQNRTWNSFLYLTQGEHIIRFWVREANAKLADIYVNYLSPLEVATSINFNENPLHSSWLGHVDASKIDCNRDIDGCSWEPQELAKVKRDFQTGQNVVEVSYPPISKGSPRVTTQKKFSSNGDEYTLSYRVKFGAHYRWARGGKMHGLGPANTVTGCRQFDLEDPAELKLKEEGWSVRMITASVGRLALYIYDQDRFNDNGCGEGFIAPDFNITDFERWYDISIYVKLNTPNEYDGEAKLFVDGEQIQQVDGLRLRKSGASDSDIQSLMFNTFYGGGSWDAAPDRTTHVQFSDFRVSRGEVPRQLTDKKVSADWSAKQARKLLSQAREIEVPSKRDNGISTNFGNYYDTAKADLDLETGVLTNWYFSNAERYNQKFLKNYAELLLRVSQLFSETTGTSLPIVELNFHSYDAGQIGFQVDNSPFRAYSRSTDPNSMLKRFIQDLVDSTNFVNLSQRNAVNSIDITYESLPSTFSKLVHRAFSHKTTSMYLPNLMRRAANLHTLEQSHYEEHPIGTSHHRAQSTIDLKVDNFGFFDYLPKYPFGKPSHVQSGVRSKAQFDEWSFSDNSTHNQALAKAYGQFLIELHDIYRLQTWRGDPTLSVIIRSTYPVKQLRVNDGHWREFDEFVHPRAVLQTIWEDFKYE